MKTQGLSFTLLLDCSPDEVYAAINNVRAWWSDSITGDSAEAHDIDGFTALPSEQATVLMPPWRQRFAGRAAIRDFLALAWKSCTGLKLVPAFASARPGYHVYQWSPAAQAWVAQSFPARAGSQQG